MKLFVLQRSNVEAIRRCCGICFLIVLLSSSVFLDHKMASLLPAFNGNVL